MGTLSAQEIERIIVFREAEAFPLFDAPEGTVAYVIEPSTGHVVAGVASMHAAIFMVLKKGMIAYAVGPAHDENGEEDYWTVERLQHLFDHNRRMYVEGIA